MKKNNLIESSKIENILANECKVLENPIFLEFGVQLGSSTSAFLNICKNEIPPWQITENGNAIRCHIKINDLKNQQTLN